MDTTGRYYAACCQTDFPSPKTQAEISSRVDRMLEMIDSAVLGYDPFFPVRLVVFPEFAQTPPVYFTVEELRERLACRFRTSIPTDTLPGTPVPRA